MPAPGCYPHRRPVSLKALEAFGKIVAAVIAADKVGEVLSGSSSKATQWWNGQKLAVLGASASGKDSLLHRLRQIEVPAAHEPTKASAKVPRFEVRYALPRGQELRMTARRVRNVGGEVEDRDRDWLGACKEADVILYLLTIEDLRARQHLVGGRVHDDLMWLAAHLRETSARSRVHLLVNKVDQQFLPGLGHEAIVEALRPAMDDLQATAGHVLSAYRHRLTGVTPTSMTDDYLFGVSFGTALQAIHDAAK